MKIVRSQLSVVRFQLLVSWLQLVVCGRVRAPKDSQLTPDNGQLTPVLLHVSCHVAIKNNPDIHRSVDPLDLFERVRIGDFHLHAEVLLLIDEDWFGEPEGSHWRWFTMSCEVSIFRVGTGAGREEPGWHLDHDLLADVERGDGVVDQLADDGA